MKYQDRNRSALPGVRHGSLAASILTVFLLALLSTLFGTADVEESANSSYSLGSDFSSSISIDREIGTHSLLGVPVYDTLQGTGDRLPYQASWGQSITWPLRFFINWEYSALWRSAVFAIPALWLCIRTVRSWLPKLPMWSLLLFGFLASSSFGLHLRQNDWSDHFVQTIGVASSSLFFMQRKFHDREVNVESEHSLVELLCLAIVLNGVVTGHPGFWPIALAVWVSLAAAFVSNQVFRYHFRQWLSGHRAGVAIVAVPLIITFVAVVQDLFVELRGLDFGSARLERTQGLFSEYAFVGVYGLSDGGSLPPVVKSVVSSIFGTTLMPLFILLDRFLPQSLRASDFRELPRVEFTASLMILSTLLGWKHLTSLPMKSLILRLFAAQVAMWLFIVASVADALPSALATSGAWMTLSIVLVFNVFIAWLLLGGISRRAPVSRSLTFLNIALVAVWCLFQFGFMTFADGPRVAKTYPSWFRGAETLQLTDWMADQRSEPGRVLMAQTPSFYDFLPLVAQGVPVVAPADPKIRASGQLQESFGFNYSINVPTFDGFTPSQIEDVFDFLGVRSVLFGLPSTGASVEPNEAGLPDIARQMEGKLQRSADFVIPQASYEVYNRSRFSAFVVDRTALNSLPMCPVLQQICPLFAESTKRDQSRTPKLELCDGSCFWKFTSPALTSDEALLLPVSFDGSLVVRDATGARWMTANVGGFLAAFSATASRETMLSIELEPDFRMWSRVSVSYINIMMVLVVVGMMLIPKLSSLRRTGRRMPKSERSKFTTQSMNQPH